MNSNKWDDRFMRLAAFVAAWSKDPSTKCGAVVARGNRVLGLGYNGFPPAIPDHANLLEVREQKYARVIHAEVNAIFDAFQKGQDLKGSTLYSFPPGLAPSCERCAAHIIAAGISRVVWYQEDTEMSRRWNPETSLAMYREAGVELVPLIVPDPWKWIVERAVHGGTEDG